jgi:hypothetical protein
MPSVQPKAATTAAREPRVIAAESVKRTPMPGVTTTISDVIRKSILIQDMLAPWWLF